ncbi:MAG: hypothetical protein IH594_03155 [Bacteroidales bacterium]|nr:hypothetical protein [Bacteroidales bacterium]
MNYLKSIGVDVYSNPFNYLDSLETGDDLSALFEVLMQFKDMHGNHPIITANSVTSNPDYDKIRASRYQQYYFESIIQTYDRKNECKDSYELIKEGMKNGLYHPQFHGREHLNVRQWLTSLQNGDTVLLNAFNAGIYGIDLITDLTLRNNFMASFDRNSKEEALEHETIVKEGSILFEKIFGYPSKSFIAPCYVWHPSLEEALINNEIKYLQGLPIQYVPIAGDKYKKIYHYQGQKNDLGQLYFVRNCFFEPALKPQFDWVENCIHRLKIIFLHEKPAIIGTHRINFIGALNEENRKRNLEQFSLLLKLILKNWPDVEFITTDRLGEIYTAGN